MEFIIDPEVRSFMAEKKKDTIILEVAETTCSDLDVQEMYIRLCDKKTADYLIRKKNYHPYFCDDCQILLPNYHLVYNPPVRFFMKKKWIFRSIGYSGVSF